MLQEEDRSSVKSNVSVFTPSQLLDFERIGLSGELFREVRQYYKQQGKSKEQMVLDLIAYQHNLEAQIAMDAKKKDKKHKHKDKDKDKEKKKKKKDKQGNSS
jgi:NTP pyrophosphatase (non-canonical NTP hydrolase)